MLNELVTLLPISIILLLMSFIKASLVTLDILGFIVIVFSILFISFCKPSIFSLSPGVWTLLRYGWKTPMLLNIGPPKAPLANVSQAPSNILTSLPRNTLS